MSLNCKLSFLPLVVYSRKKRERALICSACNEERWVRERERERLRGTKKRGVGGERVFVSE